MLASWTFFPGNGVKVVPSFMRSVGGVCRWICWFLATMLEQSPPWIVYLGMVFSGNLVLILRNNGEDYI